MKLQEPLIEQDPSTREPFVNALYFSRPFREPLQASYATDVLVLHARPGTGSNGLSGTFDIPGSDSGDWEARMLARKQFPPRVPPFDPDPLVAEAWLLYDRTRSLRSFEKPNPSFADKARLALRKFLMRHRLI